jgi:Uncharacterized protein conserved in bacteria (DUF2225)
MSATIFRRALLVATLLVTTILVVGSVTLADTSVKAKVKCAICDHEYEATFTASSSQSDQRLDLRPLPFRSIVSPPRVAVCPKCGFVEFREDAKYPKDELKALREFVLSDEYKQLAKTQTSYFRIAKMFERLKKPQSQIAYGYLQATWQAEHEEGKRPQDYLQACLDSYGKVISDEKAPAEQRQIARFLKGEMLRRLGKFQDAKTHFEALGKLEASKAAPYPKLIPLELDLIGKKDIRPHEIPTSKDEE